MAKKRESNFKKNGVSSELLPREQMERAASPHSVPPEAILAILLRTGSAGCDVMELSRRLIAAFGAIQRLVTSDWRTIEARIEKYNAEHKEKPILGLGHVKCLELAAAFELGYRAARPEPVYKDQVGGQCADMQRERIDAVGTLLDPETALCQMSILHVLALGAVTRYYERVSRMGKQQMALSDLSRYDVTQKEIGVGYMRQETE